MASKVATHLHRYKKVNIGANGKKYYVYKCMKPTCFHYIPLTLAEGKMCECSICGEPMIINRVVMSQSSGNPMTNPHCSNCIKRRKVKDVETIKEFLDGSKATP